MIRGMKKQRAGGRYGINVETLSGDKTLIPRKNKIYQFFDEGGANRTISLDTTGAFRGSRFIIKHNGDGNDTHYLDVQEDGVSIDKIYARVVKEFIFDGANWVGITVGTTFVANAGIGIGENAESYDNGIAFGWLADGHTGGMAIGGAAAAHTYGIGIGYGVGADTQGVGIGREVDADSYGVMLGNGYGGGDATLYGTCIGNVADTTEKRYSIALGSWPECTRHAELAINIDNEEDQENQMMMGSWTLQTANDTPDTMECGGLSNARFTIRAVSALSFKIMVTARDDTAGDCAAYLFKGIIKRDGANNTTLADVVKTVLHEDDASWDCDVAADDTNEALQITVTGDADNVVQWAARLDGVETHF